MFKNVLVGVDGKANGRETTTFAMKAKTPSKKYWSKYPNGRRCSRQAAATRA